MMLSSHYDVLVVGAGPAGSQLALRLARAGWKVGLIDGKRFPRAKPCGEFMSPECLPLLDELGVRRDVVGEGARSLRGMRLHGYGHRTAGDYGSVTSGRALFVHGYAIRRDVLDELLVRRAASEPDVTFHEGWPVGGLLRAADGTVVGVRARDPEGNTHEIRATWTVGADGRQSLVARELGARRFVPRLQRYALVARFRGVPCSDHGEVHLFEDGYFAASPVDSGLFTLNLVVSSLPTGRDSLEEFLLDRLQRAPELAARLASAELEGPPRVCGPLAVKTNRQVFDGAVLVGDACGFLDPLTGEGLYFAMKGASLLADSLDAALRAERSDAGALASYARARRTEFGPRTMLAKVLQHAIRRPRLAAFTLGALERHPLLTELLVGLTGDSISPGDLLSPSFWWQLRRTRGVITALAPPTRQASE